MKNYTRNIRRSELENATIIMTKSVYSRTESGKSWKKNPDEKTTEKISAEVYENIISSHSFFAHFGTERIEENYTFAGYIPVQVTSINPDSTAKHVRRFLIVSSDDEARNVYGMKF